jgi:hypothetical protein
LLSLPVSIAEPLLHLFEPFLTEFDISLRRLLRLLLERVKDKDRFSELGHIKDAVLGTSMDPDLHYSRPNRRHWAVIVRIQTELNQMELVSRFAPRFFWKFSEVFAAPPGPV